MPKVPTIQPSINTQGVNIPNPVQSRPVEEAFGGSVDAANERLGQTITSAANVGMRAVIAVKQRQDEQKLLDVQTRFQKDLQNTLLNPETDDKGMPKGYLNRELKQAKGSTVQFDQDSQKYFQTYLSAFEDPEQRLQMQKVMETHLGSAREQVIRNEGAQGRLDFTNSLKSNIDTNIAAAAGINDPVALANAVRVAQASAVGGYQHLGMGDSNSPEVHAALDEIAGKMVSQSVTALLDVDPLKARSVYEANKELIPANYRADLDAKIKGKELFIEQDAMWKTVQPFRLSDGMADLTKMHDFIYKQDMTSQRKDQIWDFVHANAQVSNHELTAKRGAMDRDFTNNLVTIKEAGAPLNEALKSAVQFGFDPTDINQKQDVIKKFYANKSETDPILYLGLWDKVQEGTASKQELVDNYTTGKISNTDFEGLWKEMTRAQVEGNDPATKMMWKQVQELADSKYSKSDTIRIPGYPGEVSSRDAFMLEMHRAGLGKRPDEIWAIANDKLKNVVVRPGSIFGNYWPDTAPAFKVDTIARIANSEKMTKLRDTYGEVLVTRAAEAINRRKDGTPVTPENIKALIDSYANGTK